MAFLNEEFTLDTLPKGTSNFEPLPEGWYNATITSAEIKDTKAGDGKLIFVKYAITGPTHQGRTVFGNLNIKNASTKAEEIGRQQLGEIMRAIGLSSVRDTDQLIGGNLSIKLVVKTGEYAGNEIKGFKAIGGGGMVSKPATAAPSAPAAGKAPPWAKK
tara:strand:+ start:2810 stop:3286 length:477 start_codon:yes stop_codon:yes gene_type:complete